MPCTEKRQQYLETNNMYITKYTVLGLEAWLEAKKYMDKECPPEMFYIKELLQNISNNFKFWNFTQLNTFNRKRSFSTYLSAKEASDECYLKSTILILFMLFQ
jgi:hypothetical protein